MPKAVWGAGDNMLTADDINNAEVSEPRSRYSGPVPPGGTYRFVIKSLHKETSSKGNPMVRVIAELDGTWQPNHAQFDGAPIFNYITLTKANAPQVRNFLDAIGATPDDLLKRAVVDENDYFTKLGVLGDPAGLLVYINTQRSKRTEQYPDPRLEVMYAGYLPVNEVDEDAEPVPDDATPGEEPPF